DGALTTLYASNPRDAIARLETLFQLEEHTVPIPLIREQIASALNIIIYTARLRDGSYKIMEIVEVQGLEHDAVKLKSLFRYSRNRTERM
ncbi:MAG TPA: CpaF family protein, partial [Ktedonobacteraceae bacterium]|nr:CpaF family protein [Ktedonobacteraceae bacterium]